MGQPLGDYAKYKQTAPDLYWDPQSVKSIKSRGPHHWTVYAGLVWFTAVGTIIPQHLPTTTMSVPSVTSLLKLPVATLRHCFLEANRANGKQTRARCLSLQPYTRRGESAPLSDQHRSHQTRAQRRNATRDINKVLTLVCKH